MPQGGYLGNGGTTALMEAACSGHMEVVEALLQCGADVNATDQVRDRL